MNVLDAGKCQRVLSVAQDLFDQTPDWVTFFRAILGTEGELSRVFPAASQVLLFRQTDAYAEIQNMLARLRSHSRRRPGPDEPTRVITVRLPKPLHDSLRAEAHERRTSMNRLAIAKLLVPVDEALLAPASGEPVEPVDAS